LRLKARTPQQQLFLINLQLREARLHLVRIAYLLLLLPR
jgi:hypothetical protein